MLIPDPDFDFLPIPDPGSRVKKAPDSGYGSATLDTVLACKAITMVFLPEHLGDGS